MSRLEKTKRNDKIFALSKRGGGSLSIRDLQKKYRFKSPKTIFNILDRVENRTDTKRK